MKQLNFSKKIFMTLVILLGFTCLVQAGVIYVDIALTTGNNDGTSWSNAYRGDTCLQTALDAAVSGDQIWVADGTYKPSKRTDINVARTETFQLKTGVAIYGGYAGCSAPDAERNIQLYVTILSGDIGTSSTTDNCYHVVTGSNTDSTAVLDGFTITKGYANGTSSPYDYGAGIYSNSGSPTVSNCTISSNTANYSGGGMYNDGSPKVSNCTFSGNTVHYYGGGMCNSGSPTISNCTFSGNTANNHGGGMYNSSSPSIISCTFSSNTASSYGGGMYNSSGSPTISYCTFSSNTANISGGGMNNYSCILTINNCTFSGNTASSRGGGMCNNYGSSSIINCTFNSNTAGSGGGMYNHSSSSIINCTFNSNTANSKGGGMLNTSGGPLTCKNCRIYNNSAVNGAGFYTTGNLSLKNCTVYQNTANSNGGAVCTNHSNANVTVCSSILWNDTASLCGPEICKGAGTITITYSDVKGGYTGTGNIDDDPEFVDPNGEDNVDGTADDNFRLCPWSPCIDAGDNSCFTDSQVDIDGNPRFIDDCSTTDTGSGTAPIIDMGAYELQDFEAFSFLKFNCMGYFGIGTFPKASLHIGGDRGLTISDTSDKALSWNAYYNNGWKYLGSDSAFQIASDYNADKLYFKTAASDSGNNTVNWTNSLTLQSDGKVGIYTAAPKERLQIGADKGATFHDGGDKALSWNAYYNSGWKYLGNDLAAQFDMDYTSHKFYLNAAPIGQANETVNWLNMFTLQADGKVGIGTKTPKGIIQIGSGKGLTFHAGTDRALSWNAYYNSGWKYLDSDYSYQLYSGSTADRLTIRTAASGQKDNSITWIDSLTYQADGSVAIGTTDSQGYKLAVKGSVIAESLTVKPFSQWPDNVFESNYPLLPISDLEKYIQDKKSLPDIPTSDYIAEKGMNVGETQVKMLQKIEELTLYVIDLKKKNDFLEKKNEAMEKKNEAMEKKNEDMEKRLAALEKGDKK